MFNTDLFKFPFISEVWGTASDWVMVLVTGITAYFLWRTLRSQTSVQNLQQDLHRIEVERFIQEQGLHISAIFNNPEIKAHIENIISYNFIIQITPKGASCKKLNTTVNLKTGELKWHDKHNPYFVSYQSNNDPVILEFRGEIERELFLESGETIQMEVQFENLLGHRFKQDFSCYFTMTSNYVPFASEPIFIP